MSNPSSGTGWPSVSWTMSAGGDGVAGSGGGWLVASTAGPGAASAARRVASVALVASVSVGPGADPPHAHNASASAMAGSAPFCIRCGLRWRTGAGYTTRATGPARCDAVRARAQCWRRAW